MPLELQERSSAILKLNQAIAHLTGAKDLLTANLPVPFIRAEWTAGIQDAQDSLDQFNTDLTD